MKWTTDEFTGRRFGKYEVLCRIAVGGMAEIFLGFAHLGPFVGRPVVLKRILAEQREDPTAMQLLIDEARTTASLSHANIAQVLDLESAGEDVLLVIEFIQGANVEELIDTFQARGEPVPLGLVLALIREAAQGLGHAHLHKDARGTLRPVIHRDVTPRNIMVDFDGVAKMLDFGIARAMGGQRRTVAGMVRGTTAYMSPEQAIGKDLDPRSDLFSLGTIFHELLTAQRLFHRANPAQEMAAVYEEAINPPSQVNRRVPRPLDAVTMKALERDKAQRYQSATELVRDLALAAGSTTWSHERVAHAVRDLFRARFEELRPLLARIPAGRDVPTDPVTAVPRYPGARAPSGRTPPRPQDATDEHAMRTMVAQGPIPSGPATGESTLVTEPGRRVPEDLLAAPTQAMTRPTSLSADDLFSDLEDGAESTRIIPGGSMSRLPQVLHDADDVSALTTDRRPSVSGGGSRGRLIAAAVGVMVLGGLGGALAYRVLSAPAPVVAASVGKLVLDADQPCEVRLGAQVLGRTPLELWLPVGAHVLTLADDDGAAYTLNAEVSADGPMVLNVTLDSLAPVP